MSDSNTPAVATWKVELPVLAGRMVTLREVEVEDSAAVADLLSLRDAARFGLDDASDDLAAGDFIARARRERAAGTAYCYVIIANATRGLIGLLQVRQLDPTFEGAEWECTMTPAARGTGAFLEAARLAGSLAFTTVGVHRLEARVPLQNGRANGALRKLGAVQEGVLRRSARRGGEYLDQVLWSILRDDWGDARLAPSQRVH